MRNSDSTNFIGFSARGKGCHGTKVRFAIEKVRRSKSLFKIGVTNLVWYQLPEAMTKVNAISYLQSQIISFNLTQVQQDALVHASKRLITHD